MPTHRPESAANIIRTIVAHFAREIPPDVAEIVSITRVEVSPDLGYAKVFLTALSNPDAAVTYLKKHANHDIRPLIAQQLKIYTVPMLRFARDERSEKAGRLEELLR